MHAGLPGRRAMTRRSTAAIIAAAVAGFLLMLGSCVAGAAVYLGVWPPVHQVREDAVVGAWTGTGGVQVTFGADHTFTATGLPFHLQNLPGAVDYTGPGTWRLVRTTRYEQEHVELALRGNHVRELQIDLRRRPVRLFIWIGDPDEGKRYWLDRSR